MANRFASCATHAGDDLPISLAAAAITANEDVCMLWRASPHCCIRYAHLLFLCAHQFEANVGRLQTLRLEQWEQLAAILLPLWTAPNAGWDLDPQVCKHGLAPT